MPRFKSVLSRISLGMLVLAMLVSGCDEVPPTIYTLMDTDIDSDGIITQGERPLDQPGQFFPLQAGAQWEYFILYIDDTDTCAFNIEGGEGLRLRWDVIGQVDEAIDDFRAWEVTKTLYLNDDDKGGEGEGEGEGEAACDTIVETFYFCLFAEPMGTPAKQVTGDEDLNRPGWLYELTDVEFDALKSSNVLDPGKVASVNALLLNSQQEPNYTRWERLYFVPGEEVQSGLFWLYNTGSLNELIFGAGIADADKGVDPCTSPISGEAAFWRGIPIEDLYCLFQNVQVGTEISQISLFNQFERLAQRSTNSPVTVRSSFASSQDGDYQGWNLFLEGWGPVMFEVDPALVTACAADQCTPAKGGDARAIAILLDQTIPDEEGLPVAQYSYCNEPLVAESNPPQFTTTCPENRVEPRTVIFIDESTPGKSPLLQWDWDFGSSIETYTLADIEDSPVCDLCSITADAFTCDTDKLGMFDKGTGLCLIHQDGLEYQLSHTFAETEDNSDPDLGDIRGLVNVRLTVTSSLNQDSSYEIDDSKTLSDFIADGEPLGEWLKVQDSSKGDSIQLVRTDDDSVLPCDLYGVYDPDIHTILANYIEVTELPNTSFSFQDNGGGDLQAPRSLTFDDTTDPGNGNRYPVLESSWDFDNGNTRTITDNCFPSENINDGIVNIFQEPGCYDVSLTTTTEVGTTSTIQNIEVTVIPTAGISIADTTPDERLAPRTVNFLDDSDANDANTCNEHPITQWYWDFGDGNDSTDQNPTHIYTQAGCYTVSLTVTNDVGEHTTTETNLIEVTTLPTADFSFPNDAPENSTVPYQVSFTDLSTTNSDNNCDSTIYEIIQWDWDFGDGNTDTITNDKGDPSIGDTTHTYTQAGCYTVALTVTNAVGQSTTAEQTIEVTTLPAANFTANKTSGNTDLEVDFTDTTATNDDNTCNQYPILSWYWDFGDGAFSEQQNPTHTYTEAGCYTVSLTVTNTIGEHTHTKIDHIDVAKMTPDFAHNLGFGSGVIEIDNVIQVPVEGDVTQFAMAFKDTSILDDDDSCTDHPITQWQWDFGDNGSSTLQNPDHIFDVPGCYQVKLTTVNKNGTKEITKAVDFIMDIDADIATSNSSGEAHLLVNFTDNTDTNDDTNCTPHPTVQWEWDFGDGSDPSTLQNPSHTYLEPGCYTVTLITSNGFFTDTTTETIDVYELPDPDFEVSNSPGLVGTEIAFTDLTDTNDDGTCQEHPITKWEWSFGDGTSTTIIDSSKSNGDTTHTYTSSGCYTVTLKVTNDIGSRTIAKTNIVDISDISASFLPAPDLATINQTTQRLTFTDTSVVDDNDNCSSHPITGWSWDFGNGQSSTDEGPHIIEYSAPGCYTVALTVSNDLGEKTKEFTLNLTTNPIAGFTSVQNDTSATPEVAFTDTSIDGDAPDPCNPFPISSWEWDFGDGGSSTQQNPTHTYAGPGCYTVKLTVTTTALKTHTVEQQVEVTSDPVADFSASPLSGPAPLTVDFTSLVDTMDDNTCTQYPVTFRFWDFGDSRGSSEENPTYTYNTPGTYTVTYLVFNDVGFDQAEKTAYITVTDPTK